MPRAEGEKEKKKNKKKKKKTHVPVQQPAALFAGPAPPGGLPVMDSFDSRDAPLNDVDSDLIVGAFCVVGCPLLIISVIGADSKRFAVKTFSITEVSNGSSRTSAPKKVVHRKKGESVALVIGTTLDWKIDNSNPVSYFIQLHDEKGSIIPIGERYLTEGDATFEYHGVHPKGAAVQLFYTPPSEYSVMYNNTRGTLETLMKTKKK